MVLNLWIEKQTIYVKNAIFYLFNQGNIIINIIEVSYRENRKFILTWFASEDDKEEDDIFNLKDILLGTWFVNNINIHIPNKLV